MAGQETNETPSSEIMGSLPQNVTMESLTMEGWLPPGVLVTVSRYQAIYSVFGLLVGVVCVLGGVVLALHGVAEPSSSWVLKAFGCESELSDAGPGAIIFVVGLFVIIATRFNIVIKRK